MKTSTLIVGAALSAATLAATATAGTVDAGTFFVIDNMSPWGFFEGTVGIDGSDTLIANQDQASWFDLAAGDTDDSVFAVRDNRLVRMNTATGVVVTDFTPSNNLRSIAFDRAGGVMYALPNTGNLDLLTVDITTGVSTVVGNLGLQLSALDMVGMGFDPTSGLLYATADGGDLYTINPADGAATFVANSGLSDPFDIDYNPADGNMYVTDAGRDALFMIDRDTAAVTPSVLYDNAMFTTGLAFPVPAPGSLALLGLAGAAAARRRR